MPDEGFRNGNNFLTKKPFPSLDNLPVYAIINIVNHCISILEVHMKTWKKIVSAVLAGMMILSTVVAVGAANVAFTDTVKI